jgi:ATP-dependent Clp protease adaptor protein ClpS
MTDFSTIQDSGQTAVAVKVRPKNERKKKPKKEPKFHVLIWNDDEHTFQYVVELLKSLFGYPEERGWQLARQVDSTGRAIVYTSSLERAEVKRDQILAFGPDPYADMITAPLIATLEKDAEND